MAASQTQHIFSIYACSTNHLSTNNGGESLRSSPRFPKQPFGSLYSKQFLKTPNILFPNIASNQRLSPHASLEGGAGNINNNKNGGGGGDGKGEGGSSEEPGKGFGIGIILAFLAGWRSRVAADPQFPFKVLMEEIVGVSACVVGDMASRPNFGLNELDFVFSTLVVGSIVNFALMYLLAPTLASSTPALPSIFASCPPSHMFEPGGYSLASRAGTFVYKGAIFAGVGFAAGLVGTALSNGLIALRKKMDPEFETPNKPPPTVLNALTWAAHMGLSSNLRYQSLNGIEFMLAKVLPPVAFKTSVLSLRGMNNVVGGMSFVMLARITGSQTVGSAADSSNVADDRKPLLAGEQLSHKDHSPLK